MTSEPARLALCNRLGEVLGADRAETLMTSLPLPATELATKSDIVRLEQRIDALAAEMRSEHNEIHKALRNHLVATF